MDFHQWIGDGWAILFSHPEDFTPVCTTELGYMAKIEPEFTRRNCKLIGSSLIIVSSVSDDEARKTYPAGFTTIKPYLRTVKQPTE